MKALATDPAATPLEQPSLKRRVLTASAWSLGGYGLSVAIRFGSNLIMTRLLMPEMFGVMAIAWVVMAGLAMFSDLGLNQSIVQNKRGSEPAFLNTAWSVQILRGLVLWASALGVSLIIFLAARYALVPPDSVYAAPSLPGVIAVLSFGAVVSGLESTKLAEASRNLALGRVTQLDLISQVVGLGFMLAWAAVDRSIWMLVGGALLAGIVRTLLSHAWLPGTLNRWHWDRAAFADIFHFGKWIFASSVLGFLVNNGDRLMLGWMVDAHVLGVYAIAVLIFSAVEQLMTRIIGTVGLPALSEVVRNGGDLKAAYYRFHWVIASIAYFCAGTLMVSGQALIYVLYDARYSQAGWMLQILAAGLIAAPFHIATQVYFALGQPSLLTRIVVFKLILLVVAMQIGFSLFGTAGAVFGIVASQLLCVPIYVLYNQRCGVFSLKMELLALPTILLGAAAGGIAAYVISHWV